MGRRAWDLPPRGLRGLGQGAVVCGSAGAGGPEAEMGKRGFAAAPEGRRLAGSSGTLVPAGLAGAL